MATNHSTYAALAVIVVIAAAGLPVLTGHATANYYDFAVTGLTYPDTQVGFPLAATVTVQNAGTLSATYARWNYEIWGQNNNVLVYSYQDYVPIIPAQGSRMITTPAYTGLKAGTYTIRFWIDSDKRFDELNEENNHYETMLVVE
jgi:subtilase family serine protease